MTFVAVATAKGAPGGTTCALLLARALADHDADAPAPAPTGAAPRSNVLLVECDPAGGDVAPRLGLPALPGLASLALAARHGLTRALLLEHSQHSAVFPGVRLLPGVAGPEQGMALAWIFSELASELSARDMMAVADIGRIRSSTEPVSPFLDRAAWALLVVADSVPSLLHARAAVDMARGRGVELHLVVTGARHHSPSEIARATTGQVLGTIASDPAALAALVHPSGSGVRRRAWSTSRNPLLADARRLVTALRATPPLVEAATGAAPPVGAADESRDRPPAARATGPGLGMVPAWPASLAGSQS
jgi:MinD-like ATPase involved in chromosome partitioning or flagellar assembly